MEVKEVIQHIKDKYEGWEGWAHSQEEVNKLGQECNEVISLLQELEKYKEMWEEFRLKYRCSQLQYYGFKTNGIDVPIAMRIFEQKHFPQPVKKVITIEVRAEGKDDVYWLNRYAKELNMNLPSRFKVNIKEEK